MPAVLPEPSVPKGVVHTPPEDVNVPVLKRHRSRCGAQGTPSQGPRSMPHPLRKTRMPKGAVRTPPEELDFLCAPRHRNRRRAQGTPTKGLRSMPAVLPEPAMPKVIVRTPPEDINVPPAPRHRNRCGAYGTRCQGLWSMPAVLPEPSMPKGVVHTPPEDINVPCCPRHRNRRRAQGTSPRQPQGHWCIPSVLQKQSLPKGVVRTPPEDRNLRLASDVTVGVAGVTSLGQRKRCRVQGPPSQGLWSIPGVPQEPSMPKVIIRTPPEDINVVPSWAKPRHRSQHSATKAIHEFSYASRNATYRSIMPNLYSSVANKASGTSGAHLGQRPRACR